MLKAIKSKLILFLLLPLSSAFGFIYLGDDAYVLSPDFIYQKERLAGISIGGGLFYDNGVIMLKAGVEKSFESSLIGAKLGFEIIGLEDTSLIEKNSLHTVIAVNLAYYSGYGKNELRLTPEVGISWYSYVTLSYR